LRLFGDCEADRVVAPRQGEKADVKGDAKGNRAANGVPKGGNAMGKKTGDGVPGIAKGDGVPGNAKGPHSLHMWDHLRRHRHTSGPLDTPR
jgi:hypothetical protein